MRQKYPAGVAEPGHSSLARRSSAAPPEQHGAHERGSDSAKHHVITDLRLLLQAAHVLAPAVTKRWTSDERQGRDERQCTEPQGGAGSFYR
jgi:hypothetical protein